MNERQFNTIIIAVGVGFTAFFAVVVLPPLFDDPDVLGAFAAGFENPYSSGYSADTIACWLILTAWVAFEATARRVRHGWVCVVLGVVPGVAVGFAAYLLLRARTLESRP